MEHAWIIFGASMKHKYNVTVHDKTFDVTLIKKQGDTITFEIQHQSYTVAVAPVLPSLAASSSTTAGAATRAAEPRIVRPETLPAHNADPQAICSPLPGVVAKMLVKSGDEVSSGQPVAIIEAMKMENVISSPWCGTINEIFVKEGAEVRKGEALMR
jgi:biotin carboxyl carrier protein